MSEKVSNNVKKYSVYSNYAFYYRQFYSEAFQTTVLGRPELPKTLPVSSEDVLWEIPTEMGNRLDMISQYWFGEDYRDFMWVIMLYNRPESNPSLATKETEEVRKKKVLFPGDEEYDPAPTVGVNPFKDFPAGRVIYIPARNTLEGRLIGS